MTEGERKLRKALEQEGIRLLKSDNICIGEKIPLPNGIVGVVCEENEISHHSEFKEREED